MAAARLIGFRCDSWLSQRELAELLGVSRRRVVELESGEKNPSIETLAKIAGATGFEFAIDIAPHGREPKLASKALRNSPAHICWRVAASGDALSHANAYRLTSCRGKLSRSS